MQRCFGSKVFVYTITIDTIYDKSALLRSIELLSKLVVQLRESCVLIIPQYVAQARLRYITRAVLSVRSSVRSVRIRVIRDLNIFHSRAGKLFCPR